MSAVLDIGVDYTRGQLESMVDQETADDLKARGLVFLFDVNSETYRLIPHSEASSAFSGKAKGGTGSFEALPPIVKRTPQERVDSLMLRWIEDCKQAGTVPGLDDLYIQQIVGEAWKAGRTEVTADVVRQVAASFLAKAEAEHEAKLSKQITRHED